VIPPRRDPDDEHTRLVTYDRAHAASAEHLDAVALVSADISATIGGASVSSDIHPVGTDQLVAHQRCDELADELTYRAALAALSGVVQRSLRDFLA
jgi:hypothetical protein